ncbi:hypothetical protein JAO82_04725 [Pontibaca sp. S1109L]|uniref:Curli production assembly/transport component CsgF n=1 Tax=Pontibaca salina TaxID=2795731 RepID=A0A934HQQ6_9RHOB|nr:hypothetical protein [Pontibaca salina]
MTAELTYAPKLPQFGGHNAQAFNILTYEKQREDAEKAKIAAARAAAEREANRKVVTNTDRLVASITNYLNVEIARRFSTEVLSGSAPSGSITVGDVTIEYVRLDGIVNLVINDENGSTTIELPVVQ